MRRVWHQYFYGLVLFWVTIEKSIKNPASKLKKAYVVSERGWPSKTPVTSESCSSWGRNVANPPFRSSDRPGLFLGFSLVEPPNIRRLQTCSLTLRQAVNEYRRPLQGLCMSSSISQVQGCHIYRRHSQWKATVTSSSVKKVSISLKASLVSGTLPSATS